METGNLHQNIPGVLPREIFDSLVLAKGVKIDRVVSRGHRSDPGFWHDQDENEWVLLVKGEAKLKFENGDRILHLTPGMYVNIAAHEKHRVEWTSPHEDTIWLAVFYPGIAGQS